jgi:hypothetical protein
LAIEDSDGLFVVNGRESNQHKSVALLLREGVVGNRREVAICTGTFVGDNVLVTAAHCIDDSNNGGLIALQVDAYDTAVIDTVAGFEQARRRGVEAVQVFHHGLTENELIGPNGEAINLDKTNLDLAVVIFPKGTAKFASALSDRMARQGDAGVIVGFGQTSHDANKPRVVATKREGEVVVAGPQTTKGLISLYSSDLSGRGGHVYASSAAGDSGGPMFVNGVLMGVGSSGGQFGGDFGRVSVYVDLFSDESKSLLQKAKAGGANLHGGASGEVRPNSQVNSGCS